MRHNELVKAAMAAIQAVFSDTGVSSTQTEDDLTTIRDEVETMLDAVRDDLKKERANDED